MAKFTKVGNILSSFGNQFLIHQILKSLDHTFDISIHGRYPDFRKVHQARKVHRTKNAENSEEVLLKPRGKFT